MCVRLTSSWTVTSMDSLERLSEKWSSMTRRWYNTLLRLDVRLWTSARDRPASSSPSESILMTGHCLACLLSSMTRRWYNTLLRLDVRLWTSAGDRHD